MDILLEEINKQESQLQKLNDQLKLRCEKYGSEFVPLTITDYKLFKIRKARETGNILYLENILLEEIQDLQEKKKKIKQRIERFYPELKVQEGQKFFEEKEVPNFSEDNVEIRYNTWYLFGVDYMSNELIRNYFNVNPHFKIQWINDSSCNIAFQTKEDADEAIKPHLKTLGMKDQSQIWYELNEYEVETVKRKLYCRLATSKDQKKQEVNGLNSKYYSWVINKQKLGSYVKKQAHYQINKTKGINRYNKFHKNSVKEQEDKRDRKRQKKEQEQDGSSSGVNDSEQKMVE